MAEVETILAGHYKIVAILRAGGFGQTYIAEDLHRPGHPQCVVKHLKPANTSPDGLQVARRLFDSEAQVLEKLGNHDQIPRLLAHFEEDQEFYLVQDLIQGHPLSQELPLGQRWGDAQVKAMLQDVLGILAFVHAQGVIHRDIKPDNLMRRELDQKFVLIDFGAIKELGNVGFNQTEAASATVAIGTPGYMPTEQGHGKPRPSSDIYALGMVAVQCLTGRLPSQLQENYETGELCWQEQAPVSPGLAQVVTQMIRYHFKDRYRTAEEVLAALQALDSGAAAVPPTAISNSPLVNPPVPVASATVAYAPASGEPSQSHYPGYPQSPPDKRQSPVLIGLLAFLLVFSLGSLGYILGFRESSDSSPQVPPTPQATATTEPPPPTPIPRRSPDDFMRQYYENINQEVYRNSWLMLSDGLRDDPQAHPDGFESYLDWWTQVRYVEIWSAIPVQVSDERAIVEMDLRYFLHSGREVSQTLRFHLIADSGNSWKLDRTQVE